MVSVQNHETGIEPGGECPGAQDTGAEAVDGGDERALGGPCLLKRPLLAQAPANPVPQFGGCFLGEGDGQDRADVDPVLQHVSHKPLDEHRGLAAAGTGVEQ